jgi:Ala-tRNA(Pro) deacylase
MHNMSPRLIEQLQKHQLAYEVIHHPYSITSLNTAHTSHIPAQKLVKPVILHDQQGYLMALVPSNSYVYLNELNMVLNRQVRLASEAEVSALFNDCDRGAIPPVGDAYDMKTIVDNSLSECTDVYMEAGNHTDVLHLSGNAFQRLTKNMQHADITVH